MAVSMAVFFIGCEEFIKCGDNKYCQGFTVWGFYQTEKMMLDFKIT